MNVKERKIDAGRKRASEGREEGSN
jgi:hypothetical protein